MTKQNLFLAMAAMLLLLFTACNQQAKTTENEQQSPADDSLDMQVIQFHSKHRCMTCRKIEKVTKQTLENYPAVDFLLVSVAKQENKEQVEEFEAAGTALFLFDPETGRKKELTKFAFMNVKDEEQYQQALADKMMAFQKEVTDGVDQ